mgnify:CR=1 FL=1
MTPERYTEILEESVPSWVVSAFGSWPVEMRLYMYLHHLQLAQMEMTSDRIHTYGESVVVASSFAAQVIFVLYQSLFKILKLIQAKAKWKQRIICVLRQR